jgi:hypothetical protein
MTIFTDRRQTFDDGLREILVAMLTAPLFRPPVLARPFLNEPELIRHVLRTPLPRLKVRRTCRLRPSSLEASVIHKSDLNLTRFLHLTKSYIKVKAFYKLTGKPAVVRATISRPLTDSHQPSTPSDRLAVLALDHRYMRSVAKDFRDLRQFRGPELARTNSRMYSSASGCSAKKRRSASTACSTSLNAGAGNRGTGLGWG